uniref:C3/C5 convertase n=1 Tax=Hasarius adansoni TaxID=243517 RepID=A0A0E3VMX8_9ARAC|nr:complement factor B-3 [Hasarius adansoni]
MYWCHSTMFTFIVCLTPLLVTSVLSAKSKTCSPYPHVSLDHGDIHRIGRQKYSFKCNNGYFLTSSSTVRCFRGNWTSSKAPRCLRIQGQCDEPPVVKHSLRYGDERHVGAKVSYVCKDGFTLLGHSQLVCSRNGRWNKRAPTCMDESEPLQTVAERLKNSFVTELAYHSSGTPEGRLLDRSSLLLGLELYLLIDRSSSIDPVHLEDAKNFVKFLLRRFGVNNKPNNNNGTRASVLAFGTEVQIVFNIDDTNISNPRIAAAAVDDIHPNGGGTNMEGALTKVLIDFQKLRKRAKRALFLMTDGEPNIANPEITPQDIAQQLKKSPNDFEIFTVGIGKGIKMNLLNELASEPPLSHVFILENYPDLNEVMKIIEDSKPPPPPISKDQCGYNVSKENRPWLATLYIGGAPFKMCSGVLICNQWVLTAASCLQDAQSRVDMKDVFVVLGERHLLKAEQGQTNFYVTDVQIHQNYNPKQNSIENNLAVLKLNLPASRYRPACLPPTDRAIPLHLNLKINASITGWGRTSASKMTYATANDIAFDMSSSSVSLSEERECPIRRRVTTPLCAGQGSKTCFALVGSPLMAEDSSTGFQHILGILVDRRHCSKKGQNQYIELTRHIGWINQATSNCQLKHWGVAK